jgi:ABC-2 type transport system permease protein
VIARAELLRHEWRLLRHERVALPALVLLAVLLMLAAYNGRVVIDDQVRAGATFAAQATELRGALAAQAARGVDAATSPGSVGYSVYAEPVSLPPAALSGVVIGQSDLLPATYSLTAKGAHRFLAAPPLDNPLRLAFGGFDLVFVLVFILPLVIIALLFDVVAGERERGVWPIAVAQGAALLPMVLGKCLARALAVGVALLLALPVAALVAGFELRQDAALARMGLWLLAALLYAAFWIALSLWVNARPRASDRNASLLAAAWLLLVVVAPPATNLIATTWYPAPSRVALTTELREATEEADREAAQERDRYFFDHPEMQGGEMDRTAYFKSVARSERQIDAAMRPLLAAFDERAAEQRSVIDGLQYASPATLFYRIATALAGSDGVRHAAFRRQAVDFHAVWSEYFGMRLERSAPLGPTDYDSLPTFRFVEPPLTSDAAQRLWLPMLALALVTIALAWHAISRLRRMPVS